MNHILCTTCGKYDGDCNCCETKGRTRPRPPDNPNDGSSVQGNRQSFGFDYNNNIGTEQNQENQDASEIRTPEVPKAESKTKQSQMLSYIEEVDKSFTPQQPVSTVQNSTIVNQTELINNSNRNTKGQTTTRLDNCKDVLPATSGRYYFSVRNKTFEKEIGNTTENSTNNNKTMAPQGKSEPEIVIQPIIHQVPIFAQYPFAQCYPCAPFCCPCGQACNNQLYDYSGECIIQLLVPLICSMYNQQNQPPSSKAHSKAYSAQNTRKSKRKKKSVDADTSDTLIDITIENDKIPKDSSSNDFEPNASANDPRPSSSHQGYSASKFSRHNSTVARKFEQNNDIQTTAQRTPGGSLIITIHQNSDSPIGNFDSSINYHSQEFQKPQNSNVVLEYEKSQSSRGVLEHQPSQNNHVVLEHENSQNNLAALEHQQSQNSRVIQEDEISQNSYEILEHQQSQNSHIIQDKQQPQNSHVIQDKQQPQSSHVVQDDQPQISHVPQKDQQLKNGNAVQCIQRLPYCPVIYAPRHQNNSLRPPCPPLGKPHEPYRASEGVQTISDPITFQSDYNQTDSEMFITVGSENENALATINKMDLNSTPKVEHVSKKYRCLPKPNFVASHTDLTNPTENNKISPKDSAVLREINAKVATPDIKSGHGKSTENKGNFSTDTSLSSEDSYMGSSSSSEDSSSVSKTTDELPNRKRNTNNHPRKKASLSSEDSRSSFSEESSSVSKIIDEPPNRKRNANNHPHKKASLPSENSSDISDFSNLSSEDSTSVLKSGNEPPTRKTNADNHLHQRAKDKNERENHNQKPHEHQNHLTQQKHEDHRNEQGHQDHLKQQGLKNHHNQQRHQDHLYQQEHHNHHNQQRHQGHTTLTGYNTHNQNEYEQNALNENQYQHFDNQEHHYPNHNQRGQQEIHHPTEYRNSNNAHNCIMHRTEQPLVRICHKPLPPPKPVCKPICPPRPLC